MPSDSIAEALSLKIIDLMVNDTAFNDILAFFVGVPTRVMSDLMPNCEVAIATSEPVEVVLGGREKHHYLGQVRFYQNYQDLIAVTNRVAIVPSYRAVYTFNQKFKNLFSIRANKTLGGFSGTIDNIGYAVIEMRLGQASYGISPEEDRLENWSNWGNVDFRISTYETPTT